MNILLTGATGYIGQSVIRELLPQGHHILACCRHPGRLDLTTSQIQLISVDYRQMLEPESWYEYLKAVDVVINCVGIIVEIPQQRFEILHTKAPIALFNAAVTLGVKKIIQLSALGADEYAQSAYHLSKKAADDVLRQLPITHIILQPSIVYGHGAVSTELFSALAALPVHFLPNNGQSLLQPIHIDDVVACVCRCLEPDITESRTYNLVGAEPIKYRDYLQGLRKRLGKPAAQTYTLNQCSGSLLTTLMPLLGESMLSKDNLSMLQKGNYGDANDTSALLKRSPQNVTTWLSIPASQAERWYAHMYFYKPALHYCIAFVWLWSGITSLFFYPHQQSYELLAQLGIHNAWAVATLYGLAGLDLAMGLAIQYRYRLMTTLLMQIWLVLGYSIVIAVYLPEFWLHPFGPLLKNLPFLLCLSIYRVAEGEKP